MPGKLSEVFNVVKSSPNKGTIKISLNPAKELKVGDAVQMKVSLTAPGGGFDEIFWVKIVDETAKKEKTPKPEEDNEPLGLPQLIFMYKEVNEDEKNHVPWTAVEEATSFDIDHKTVMIPEAEGEVLKSIYVNMDSAVLRTFKSGYKNMNEEQLQISNRKYYTSVYFHTLFLYTISKNRGYSIQRKMEDKDEPEPVDIGEYLKDVFDHYYSTFILNFGGMEEMMQGIGD